MKNRIPKERIIYSNYDLHEKYPDEDLKELAKENSWIDEGEEVTDEMLWNWRYEEDIFDWENEKEILDNFFKNIPYIGFFGEVGRWNGVYKGGKVGTDFWELFNKAITDCDYIKIYDENGHMYLTCSHHDGTCHFEIKEITEQGYDYLNNWEYNWDDNRTSEYVHNQIYKKYSRLPHFAQKVYGCPMREYEESTKEKLIGKLNNQARSFY